LQRPFQRLIPSRDTATYCGELAINLDLIPDHQLLFLAWVTLVLHTARTREGIAICSGYNNWQLSRYQRESYPPKMYTQRGTDNLSTDTESLRQSHLGSTWSSESSYIVETPTMRFDATPDASVDDQPVIGIIGMGEMGKMYAKTLSRAGWAK
jgi:hypothetical protein